jgi:hypothetical protein
LQLLPTVPAPVPVGPAGCDELLCVLLVVDGVDCWVTLLGADAVVLVEPVAELVG